MKSLLAGLVFTALALSAEADGTSPVSARQEYYAIRIYSLQTALQESRVDSFLRSAYLPALHRRHIAGIGVFRPVGNDTAAIRRIYVFIPVKSLEQFEELPGELAADAQYQADGRSYLTAGYDNPPYARIETVLLRAFPDMPQHAAPWSGQRYSADRIYELRSYEGPTESYFANKVQMFNKGGEITLFEKLGFHAVFYASVISGAHMPNLMYMTSFENRSARDEHWKAFGADPTWKALSSSPEYQHNVSHIDDIFLQAAPYSDL
ncbi:MAG TPA: NIPSNAP family protein [Puia sp.]|nr:NIPSNAP family protein [Puia sp.]